MTKIGPMHDTDKSDFDLHRNIAARCNNAAWDLIERETLSPVEATELLTLAASARHHWREVGTTRQIAHADVLFGWAAPRCGAAQTAFCAADEALATFQAEEGTEPWELAFAHAAMAAAMQACGNLDAAGEHQGAAENIASELDADTVRLFEKAFKTLRSDEIARKGDGDKSRPMPSAG